MATASLSLRSMAKRLGTQLFNCHFSQTIKSLRLYFHPSVLLKKSVARLIRDPKTQRPKGFGFVTFETETEAHKALKAMNGRFVRGRLIFVEFAHDKESKTDTNS